MENVIFLNFNQGKINYPGVIVFGKNPFCQFNVKKSILPSVETLTVNYAGLNVELVKVKPKTFVGAGDGIKFDVSITETKNYQCGFLEVSDV